MTPDPIKQEQKWELKLWHLILIGAIIFLAGCVFLLWKYHQADRPEPVSEIGHTNAEDTETVGLTFSESHPSNLRVKK